MVEFGGTFWRRHLLFRDFLRSHPEEARRSAALKRNFAIRFRDDREAYTEAEAAFVPEIEERAREGARVR